MSAALPSATGVEAYTNAFVRRKPHTRLFKEEGVIANHPKWPLVIYKSAVRMPGGLNQASRNKGGGPDVHFEVLAAAPRSPC